jgi:5-formyltetrahydrofolate cyclo-ligase
MTKSELRKVYLTRQKALSPAERSTQSQQIADRFFDTVDLRSANYLHCFIAIDKFNEVDTTLIFQRLWKEHPDLVTLVPRVNFESGEIENLKFTRDTELVRNVWGIHEPSHDEFVETAKIDIVIVPLLCFDESGHRVGYGKGFYDKFLSTCRTACLKTGLSYFPPVKKIDDAADHDVRLDLCITPGLVYRFT